MQQRFNNIQDYICQRRDERGLSQEQLVTELMLFDTDFEGVDAQTLSRWERGKVSPNILRQILIMHFFGDDPKALLSDDDFEIKQLPCKLNYLKFIRQHSGLPNGLGDHPYADRSQQFVRRNKFVCDLDQLGRRIVAYHNNLSHGRDSWGPAFIDFIMAHEATFVLGYWIDEVISGHTLMIRLKPGILDKILRYELKETDLSIDDLADWDSPCELYNLSSYAGTTDIHMDAMAQMTKLMMYDEQILAMGSKSRTDFSVRFSDMVSAKRQAVGALLDTKKAGVRYKGERYDSISYRMTRDEFISSPIYINVVRANGD